MNVISEYRASYGFQCIEFICFNAVRIALLNLQKYVDGVTLSKLSDVHPSKMHT